MTARTQTERRLEASISLATIRNALFDLASELRDGTYCVCPHCGQGNWSNQNDKFADRISEIDTKVRRFGEQARELSR